LEGGWREDGGRMEDLTHGEKKAVFLFLFLPQCGLPPTTLSDSTNPGCQSLTTSRSGMNPKNILEHTSAKKRKKNLNWGTCIDLIQAV
jgi:hypothetical protein